MTLGGHIPGKSVNVSSQTYCLFISHHLISSPSSIFRFVYFICLFQFLSLIFCVPSLPILSFHHSFPPTLKLGLKSLAQSEVALGFFTVTSTVRKEADPENRVSFPSEQNEGKVRAEQAGYGFCSRHTGARRFSIQHPIKQNHVPWV